MEKYVTKQEYRDAKGVDLDAELRGLDDPSNKSKRFIKEITDWCVGYLIRKHRAFVLLDWPETGSPTNDLLTEKRQRLFREGVIEQMEYVLSNGNVSQHSGFNADVWAVIDLSGIEMSRNALAKFWLGGFANA